MSQEPDMPAVTSMKTIFADYKIDIDQFITPLIDWMTVDLRPVFQLIRLPFAWILNLIGDALVGAPAQWILVLVFLLGWQVSGLRTAVGSVLGLVALGFIGVWDETMVTLSLVVTAVLFSVLLGIPTGVLMAKVRLFRRIVRPLLDAMQTLPAFVYLIPVVVMFGIGNVAGVIVTIIYAIPPVIRLTYLGISSVPEDLREVGNAYGASGLQLLRRVEFPLAIPTIMAGVNQTIMMALGMVVYSSMIAVKGLGLLVLRGIGSMDMGLAVAGGAGIVVLAMILDRMSERAFIVGARNVSRQRLKPSTIVGAICRRARTGMLKQHGG